MNPDIERILYSKEAIDEKVKQLGACITKDYQGKKPLFICVLKGASIFFTDLVRTVDLPCEIDFIVAKSYGNNAYSSGELKILKEPDTDIKGRDVIIVEDILDTAVTLNKLIHTFSLREPSSLKIAVFIEKDIQRKININVDYKCFNAENEFLVGYGLDYAEQYRNLPYVGVLKKEVYQK